MSQTGNFPQLVALSGLEGLLNQTLTGTQEGRHRLKALHGTAIRIRSERPRWVLYLLLYDDGVELLTEYEGSVDIRVRGPMGAMVHWLFSSQPLGEDTDLRVHGNEQAVNELGALIQHFSLWPLVRDWLDDHVRLKELLAVLRKEDPVWLEKLATLPQQVGDIAEQLAHQQLMQEDILDELRGLRGELHRARQLDLFFMLTGMVLIVLSLLRASGQWLEAWQALQQDTLSLAMLSLGLGCVVARLLPRLSRR